MHACNTRKEVICPDAKQKCDIVETFSNFIRLSVSLDSIKDVAPKLISAIQNKPVCDTPLDELRKQFNSAIDVLYLFLLLLTFTDCSSQLRRSARLFCTL